MESSKTLVRYKEVVRGKRKDQGKSKTLNERSTKKQVNIQRLSEESTNPRQDVRKVRGEKHKTLVRL